MPDEAPQAADERAPANPSPSFTRIRLPSSRFGASGVSGDAARRAAGEPSERPRLELRGEVARGGVGLVILGHDNDIGRDVAVKVLRPDHRDDPALLRRFVEEAQIGGQLQHPGIVPVYDVGLLDGSPYFTMKLIKGATFASLLAERPSPAADLHRFLAIFGHVCETMAYAHARGVVHRDLKPANVMVGAFGEVLVVDWGMGKVLHRDAAGGSAAPVDAQSRQTIVRTVRTGRADADSEDGSIAGTPWYMAPEQARGDVESMDERSDVFSLGAILTEILTGDPPYRGTDAVQTVRAAGRCQTEEALARIDACGADADLILLAKQCLAAEKEQRPSDAGVPARRIADHLAGVGRRAEEARIAATAAQRTKRAALKFGAAVAVALVAAVFFWRDAATQRGRAEQREKDTLAAKALVEERNTRLELVDYAARLRRAQDAIHAGRLGGLGTELDAIDPRFRGFEWEWLRCQVTTPAPRVLESEDGPMGTAEVSEDGATLLSSSFAGHATAFELSSGRKLWRVPDAGQRFAWLGDGRAAALRFDGRLAILDGRTGATLAEVRSLPFAHALAASDDGAVLAVGSVDGRVEIRKSADLSLALPVELGEGPVNELAFAPGAERLLVATQTGGAVILDVKTGAASRTFRLRRSADPEPANSVAWSPSGDRVIATFHGGRSAVWDAADGGLLRELELHQVGDDSEWWATSGRFDPAGGAALTCGVDRVLRVHDVDSGRRLGLLRPRASLALADADVVGARFAGASGAVVTWGTNRRLFVWDRVSPAAPSDVRSAERAAPCGAAVPTADGAAILFVDRDGRLLRRDLATPADRVLARVGSVAPAGLASGGIALMPGGASVVVVAADLHLLVIDVARGDVRQSLGAPDDVVRECSARGYYAMDVDVSPDGRRVAVAVGTHAVDRDYAHRAPVLVYDLSGAAHASIVGGHMGTAAGVRFSPDGRSAASIGFDDKLMLWSAAADGSPATEFGSSKGRGYAVAFSSDGAHVAFGTESGDVRVFDVASRRELPGDSTAALHEAVVLLRFVGPGARLLAVGQRGAVALSALDGPPILSTELPFADLAVVRANADLSVLCATSWFPPIVRTWRLRRTGPDSASPSSSEMRAADDAVARSVSSSSAVAALRTDAKQEAAVRAAADASAALLPPDSDAMNAAAWRIVCDAACSAEKATEALRLARAAVDADEPGTSIHASDLATLGAALFRTGDAEGAYRVLGDSDALVGFLDPNSRSPATIAFRALAAARLQRDAEARAFLGEARRRLATGGWDAANRAAVEEAARTIK